jgi:hypothetical protein
MELNKRVKAGRATAWLIASPIISEVSPPTLQLGFDWSKKQPETGAACLRPH